MKKIEKEEIEEYREIIKKILRSFDKVPFHIIVEALIGFSIEPVDLHTEKDLSLIDEICLIADKVIEKYYQNAISRSVYKSIMGKSPRAFRPNEAGVVVEYEFPLVYQAMSSKFKVIKSIKHLKGKGYPDTLILDTFGKPTFVEIKATTKPDEGSPRDFYFTPLEKAKQAITMDAKHLLLGFVIRETKPEEYNTIGWKLCDLSKIVVSMKPEFNANNLEIYKKEAVIRENWIE
jgi:hypothetical protein